MRFKLNLLELQFRHSVEEIDLSASITFFHGKISSGKSTILNLIDACLGGKLPKTNAIQQELVSARLEAEVGAHEVIFERAAGSNQVQVTWRDQNGVGASLLAPIDNSDRPIWNDNIYGLSDLIFELAGVGPMKVRRNKTDPDAPLIPLSFRDLMWYCYLDQDDLDSTFFHLEAEDPRLPKSRDVMRFALGYYTERLNELERALAYEVQEGQTKKESAERLRKLLSELGYDSELEIQAALESTRAKILSAQDDLEILRRTHATNTHFADDLRQRLRLMSEEVAQAEEAVANLDEFISREHSLRDEILSMKFRLKRLITASAVLTEVEFSNCPRCGSDLARLTRSEDQCVLCGTPGETRRSESTGPSPDQTDLDTRLAEIEQSLLLRQKSRDRQNRRLYELKLEKKALDDRLNDELKTYDSAFLSQSRALEREIAGLEQELVTLNRDARLPEALRRMESEADKHASNASEIRRDITREREKLAGQGGLIRTLEEYFFEALQAAGLPALTADDTVLINSRNWMAYLCPRGDEQMRIDYQGLSSGGKKTLYKVCYAIALHRLSEEFNLPLPTFLMIDSPMKNIGNDVNKDIFLALYAYIYGLCATVLSETQLIIADTDIAQPPPGIHFRERLMIPGSAEYPPLIPYYSGH